MLLFVVMGLHSSSFLEMMLTISLLKTTRHSCQTFYQYSGAFHTLQNIKRGKWKVDESRAVRDEPVWSGELVEFHFHTWSLSKKSAEPNSVFICTFSVVV